MKLRQNDPVLCIFCGNRKRSVVVKCGDCGRVPTTDVELARSFYASEKARFGEMGVGVTERELALLAVRIRAGDVEWPAEEIERIQARVSDFRSGTPWWSGLLVYGGFLVSIGLLGTVVWALLRKLSILP